MKKNKIYLGDKITTKQTAECGEGKKGIILCKHRESETIYGIKFPDEHKTFHKLQTDDKAKGLLNKNEGLWLDINDFIVDTTPKEDKRIFNELMISNYIITLENIPHEIQRSKELIASCQRAIEDRLRYNQSQKEEIISHTKIIDKLEKKSNPEMEDYDAIYKKLKKYKDIKDILVKDNYIIIKTNDLIYHHKNNVILDFNLGAYYIFIPQDLGYEVRIVNYKKQLLQGKYAHPCVKEDGFVCMGDEVKKNVNKYRKENQLQFLVYLLINFLKEPNYGTPFIYAENFRCAQPVTYKPKNILDYMSFYSWRNYQRFDNKLYLKTQMDKLLEDVARFQADNINLDLINTYNSRIENLEREYNETLITTEADKKLKAFVNLVDTEISGMAKSTITEDKDVIITDFMIFEQEVTGSNTLISDESQAKFLNELMKTKQDAGKWNIWWHSHCDMGIFWSATDDKTIIEHTNQSYLISLVTNKKGELKARLDIYPKDTSPFKQATYCKFDIEEIEIYETPTEFKQRTKYEKEVEKLETEMEKRLAAIDKKYEFKDIKKIEEFCQKEIDAKIKQKTYPVTTCSYNQDHFNFSRQDYSKGWKPSKKWNWFEGIVVDLDDLQKGIDDDDWFNKQNRYALGYN